MQTDMEEDMGAAAAAEEAPHRLMKFRRNHHVGSLLLMIMITYVLLLQQPQPAMVRALAAQQTEEPVTRISFGSCANQSAPQVSLSLSLSSGILQRNSFFAFAALPKMT